MTYGFEYGMPGGFEWLVILCSACFWLVLLIVPIIYIIVSIRQRKDIVRRIGQMAEQISLLRQQLSEQARRNDRSDQDN